MSAVPGFSSARAKTHPNTKTARVTPSGRAVLRRPHMFAPPSRLKVRSLRSLPTLTRLRSARPNANPAGRRHPPPAAPARVRPVSPASRGDSTPPPPGSRLARWRTRPASTALRPRLSAPLRRLKVRSLRSLSTWTRLRSARPNPTGLRSAPAGLGDEIVPEEGRYAHEWTHVPPLLRNDVWGRGH